MVLQVCDSPEPQKIWTRVEIGVAATPSEQLTFPEVGYLVACSHSHSRPALLCTLGNCISQAPLPSGFLVGLANGKHWQEGGGENPRYVSRSASGCLYACGGLLCGPSFMVSGPVGQGQLCFPFLSGGTRYWTLITLSLPYDPPA